MKIASGTDKGLMRTHNEDNYLTAVLSDRAVLAVVCDGMGGVNGGEIASETAVNIITEHISNGYTDTCSGNHIIELLVDAIKLANSRIFNLSQDDPSLKGMGTTVVVAVVRDDVLHIAHAGDSRAYLIDTNNNTTQITVDHSFVQKLVEEGQITKEEAKSHPQKNLITRAVGVADVIQVDYNKYDFYGGCLLVMCTDGLSNYLKDGDFKRILEPVPFDEYPDALIKFANDQGGADNITVVVVA